MKARIIIVVLVLLAIGWGVWEYQKNSQVNPDAVQPTLSNGSNDENLDQDMSTIDAQLTAVEAASTDVDASFTDESSLK